MFYSGSVPKKKGEKKKIMSYSGSCTQKGEKKRHNSENFLNNSCLKFLINLDLRRITSPKDINRSLLKGYGFPKFERNSCEESQSTTPVSIHP